MYYPGVDRTWKCQKKESLKCECLRKLYILYIFFFRVTIYIYNWVSGAPCAIQAQWGTHLADVWHFEDLTRQFLLASWIGSYGNSGTKVGISFG